MSDWPSIPGDPYLPPGVSQRDLDGSYGCEDCGVEISEEQATQTVNDLDEALCESCVQKRLQDDEEDEDNDA